MRTSDKKDNVKISVVMGIYNCAETLAESIDSLMEQTYQNFELIMCDDGSKDDTYEIAMQYQRKYPHKITVIKNDVNQGLNITLNNCIKLAKGEFLARQDGDDVSLPERFEKELEFLEKHPEFALVSTPMIFFDENGEWGRGKAIREPQVKDFLKHSPFFCHAPVMMRKSVVEEVGGYTVDKRMLRFEDCNLWYKIYAKGYKGYNLQEPLYMMRDDKNAAARRTVKSRLNGFYVGYTGYKMLKMPFYCYFILFGKNILGVIKSLLPNKVYQYFHKKRLGT